MDSRDALNTRIAQSDFLVVYAMTPWSGPCRMMTVSINTLATDYIGRATFAQVNLEAVPAIAEQFGITTVPTLLFFSAGRLVYTIIGLRTQAEIASELEEFL
ncbi:MAG: thioredoxin family protein [Cyanobacteria bacterium P01_A01_bin.135]